MDLITVTGIYPLAYHASTRHRFDFANQEITLLIQVFAKMHQRPGLYFHSSAKHVEQVS